jgi:hypothetical protein
MRARKAKTGWQRRWPGYLITPLVIAIAIFKI